MVSEYTVYNGEVLNRKTGFKVRGQFEIKYGKTKISISKVNPKTGETKFVGFSKKMTPKVEKVAKKLQQKRWNKEKNKALRESGLTKFAKEEYERKMLQKKQEEFEEQTYTLPDDFEQGKLSREAVRHIGRLKRSGDLLDRDVTTGLDIAVVFNRDTQNMINFERILGSMENDGTLNLDKINAMIRNGRELSFTEMGTDDVFKNSEFASILPSSEFSSVEEFTNWAFRQYRDGDTNKRTNLWDMLHSLYPEQGYTYNPLSL